MTRRSPVIATPEDGQRFLLNAVTESQLQRQLLDVADLLGYPAFHDPDVRKCPHCGRVEPDRRRRGFPDLVIAAPPTLYVWELKTMRGRPSPEQEAWLDALAKCERVASGLVRPCDAEDVTEMLTGGKR